MKIFKKLLSFGLASVMAASALIPAFAAEKKYDEPSAADPEKWYMYGDIDRDGKVSTSDARSILRLACRLDEPADEASMKFASGDYDRDGILSSRDARLVLRVALKLSAPAEQTAHPYANKKSISVGDAIARMQTLNTILKPNKLEDRTEYVYSANQTCKVDILISDSLKMDPLFGPEIKDELTEMARETEKENTFTEPARTVSKYGTYNGYLQLKNNSSTVFGDIDASNVKSTSFSYNAAANTYTIRINFKDSTTTLNSGDSPLRQAISDITSASQLKEAVNMPDDSGFKMTFEAKIGKTKYVVQDVVSNAYVQYTFNAVTNKPLSAVYGYTSTVTIPTTFTIALVDKSFVMITKQSLTMNYIFNS